jgi:hypothetical protein
MILWQVQFLKSNFVSLQPVIISSHKELNVDEFDRIDYLRLDKNVESYLEAIFIGACSFVCIFEPNALCKK